MSVVADRDWYAWHAQYDRPGTVLARRLAAIQDQIRAALDTAPPGPIRAISMCAGQGRDLLGVLVGHARRDVYLQAARPGARPAQDSSRVGSPAWLILARSSTGSLTPTRRSVGR
jgi:hypothetical protein